MSLDQSQQFSTETSRGLVRNLQPRQQDLLLRVEAIFFQNGYRRVTMNDLAAQLRCSKRALYELASNRQELFLLAVSRWAERIQSLGHEAAARIDNPKDRLAAYLAPGVAESAGMSELFLADLRDLPDARAILERHQRKRMSVLRDIVDDGIARGFFAPLHAHLVAGVCLAAVSRINDPDFLREAELSFSQAFEELYRLLMTGLDATEAGVEEA